MIRARILVWMMNLWPPYFGAGIRVKWLNSDLSEIGVSMKLRFYNTNAVGTHFGGSLYSMTDPFYMLLLLHHLGRDYIVWDKSASIRFRKPGRGRVTAHFKLSPETVSQIKNSVKEHGRAEPVFIVEVRDESGELVSVVEKQLSVKAKRPESWVT